jgi:hypothetical protein
LSGLFWKDLNTAKSLDHSEQFTHEEVENGIRFLNGMKEGQILQINRVQNEFLTFLHIHDDLILYLSQDFQKKDLIPEKKGKHKNYKRIKFRCKRRKRKFLIK